MHPFPVVSCPGLRSTPATHCCTQQLRRAYSLRVPRRWQCRQLTHQRASASDVVRHTPCTCWCGPDTAVGQCLGGSRVPAPLYTSRTARQQFVSGARAVHCSRYNSTCVLMWLLRQQSDQSWRCCWWCFFPAGPCHPDGLHLSSKRIKDGLEAHISLPPKYCAFPGDNR